MTTTSGILVSLLGWMAHWLGLELELPEGLFVAPLDARELSDQLQFGRD